MKKQGVTSVAANGVSGNVLAGSIVELINRPSQVRFYVVGAATGLKATINSGAETLMEESDVSQANRFPIDPDDLVVRDVAMPGDRLGLNLRNTTAGALNVFWAVDVQPLK